jgi:putative ABC transport system permease protein
VSALAAVVTIVAVALGSLAARGPTVRRPQTRRRRLTLLWEAPVLVAALADAIVIGRGGGLVRDQAVGAHPRLAVVLLPLLVAAGLSGLLARLARRALRRRGSSSVVAFLALRRLAGARSLLVLLTVTAAVSFAALCFAEVLNSSLAANSAEKAYVANGADVQGLIDPGQVLPSGFPYPIAKVRQSLDIVRVEGAGDAPIEALVVDPAALRRVLRWRWSGDPDAALGALISSHARLPVIANGAMRHARAILIGGARIPVHVVATTSSFPGLIAGEPLLVMPSRRLAREAAAAGISGDPLDQATTFVWVRGPAAEVVPALNRSSLAPSFVTTVDHFLQSAELTTADRTYGFLRVVALAAALVSLIGLLLYLQARGRTQRVTSAFLARMGMGAARQAGSFALEAAALVAFAVVVGGGSALAASRPVVTRVDPLPQYAPAATVVVPWSLLAAAALVLVVAAAAAGALASLAAGRAEVGEALRVA